MTAVVIDASAGVEIVGDTRRGRALARLLPFGAEGWVPEHFFVEVIGALRRQLIVEKVINEDQARAALARLRRWHVHRASVRPLGDAAWNYRHNVAVADAVYIALAHHLSAAFLTDDHNLANTPTLPRHVEVLTLPKAASS